MTFDDPPTYKVGGNCDHELDMDLSLPMTNHVAVWTITKKTDALTLHCNGELIFHYKFHDKCTSSWGADFSFLKFMKETGKGDDTASDEYRQRPEGMIS